jgi:hypothetical protein
MTGLLKNLLSPSCVVAYQEVEHGPGGKSGPVGCVRSMAWSQRFLQIDHVCGLLKIGEALD